MSLTVMPVIIFYEQLSFNCLQRWISRLPWKSSFLFPLHLAATAGRHKNPFGHWLNYNRLICEIGFWLNKSCASSVKCYCCVGSAPEFWWGEMKTKQDVQPALRLFLNPRGFSEMLIAALEIWLLLLLATNCSKDNNMLYHKAQYRLTTVPSLSMVHQSFLWPIIYFLLHHCHHHYMPLVITIKPNSGELQSNISLLSLCNTRGSSLAAAAVLLLK